MPPILALYLWPVFSWVILSKYRLPLGILIVMVAGYLLLPVRMAINFPMVPPLTKHGIPVLAVLVIAALMASKNKDIYQRPGLLPKSWLARGLMASLILGALGTAVTNGDRIVTPLEIKPGLTLYEGASMGIAYAILILPVLVGRKYFASPDTHRLILIVLCIAACIYALPTLFEVRMSPRLNRWIYGFTQHSWAQHVRGGGFRPMVFLEHGLKVSLFFTLALIATIGLIRARWKPGLMFYAVFWLAGTMVLTKSLGAVMIAVMMIPLILFLNTRLILLAAGIIGMIVLTYPILRSANLAPIGQVIAVASWVNPVRGSSFNTRLENEEILLERANKRPLFGWGGYGRSRERNEKGRDIVIPDGYWVIIIGVGGWARYIGEFGLMTAPMLLLAYRRSSLNVTTETAVLSVVLAANMIDLIPNSGQTPITWLIAGALWGRLEYGVGKPGEDTGDPPPSQEENPRTTPRVYARDFGKKPPPRVSPNRQERFYRTRSSLKEPFA